MPNDNAETMLYHLARGTGFDDKGHPAGSGRIIRPPLALKREETEAYLEEKGQKFWPMPPTRRICVPPQPDAPWILLVTEELNSSEAVRHMGRTGEML